MDMVNVEFDRAFNMAMWMAETVILQNMMEGAGEDPKAAMDLASMLDQVETYHKRGEA